MISRRTPCQPVLWRLTTRAGVIASAGLPISQTSPSRRLGPWLDRACFSKQPLRRPSDVSSRHGRLKSGAELARFARRVAFGITE